MLINICFVAILCVSQITSENVECTINGVRMRHPSSISRYLECKNSYWKMKTCDGDYIFDSKLSECVVAEIMIAEGAQIPEGNNDIPDVEDVTVSAEVVNDTISNPQEESHLAEPTATDKTLVDGEIIASKEEHTDGPITSEETPVVRKSIAENSKGKLGQEFTEKPVQWVPGPIVNTKTMKTKANWTTSVLNGVAVYTDISYYQSHGRSYQFRVPGGLPAEQNQVISWIRENSHKYPQIEIPYAEKEEKNPTLDSFPTGLPSRCGTKFLDKLSGGKATPIEDNPWQVAILRRADNAYVCGGAVITRRHVISAAHCFKQKNKRYTPNDIILRVGDYDKEVREESQVDYSVIQMLIHEQYHEKKHIHDIVVLAASDNIPFSAHIYPICLPPSNVAYTPGHKCTVSGWGQVEAEDVPTRYLRSGEVTIISKDECRRKTIFSRGVPIEVFCAEDPTKSGIDTCLGDSGGPFACNDNGIFYLFGITAFGSYPCGQDIPSFYTNVSHYRDWILQQIIKKIN